MNTYYIRQGHGWSKSWMERAFEYTYPIMIDAIDEYVKRLSPGKHDISVMVNGQIHELKVEIERKITWKLVTY